MNIKITGRHITVTDNLKEYAEKKISKLETYFNQIIDAHIIMFVEKLDHIAEVLINGDGVQFHGREKSSDLYASVDLLFEKMEKQIRRYKEKHSSHKVVNINKLSTFEVTDESGIQLKMNQVSNKPIDKIEAFLQMRNDNAEFILFKQGISEVDSELDYSNKNYAVIYKKNDAVKMVEIPFENVKEYKYENINFIEYDMNIINDSLSNPNIEFKKNDSCSIEEMDISEAIDVIKAEKKSFLPFFNIESQYLNVIYNNGKEYEIIVPAY